MRIRRKYNFSPRSIRKGPINKYRLTDITVTIQLKHICQQIEILLAALSLQWKDHFGQRIYTLETCPLTD